MNKNQNLSTEDFEGEKSFLEQLFNYLPVGLHFIAV
jgi:hypothetical protein